MSQPAVNIGIWYPSIVPRGSVILNYTRCVICLQPMLRDEGHFIPICWRLSCYNMRLAKHNKTLDVLYAKTTQELLEIAWRARRAERVGVEIEEQEHEEAMLRRMELREARDTSRLVKQTRAVRKHGQERSGHYGGRNTRSGLFSKHRPIDANDKQLLQMLHAGASWKQIASAFDVPSSSVYMWGNILWQRLGVDNKYDAIREALRRGLIEEAHRA